MPETSTLIPCDGKNYTVELASVPTPPATNNAYSDSSPRGRGRSGRKP